MRLHRIHRHIVHVLAMTLCFIIVYIINGYVFGQRVLRDYVLAPIPFYADGLDLWHTFFTVDGKQPDFYSKLFVLWAHNLGPYESPTWRYVENFTGGFVSIGKVWRHALWSRRQMSPDGKPLPRTATILACLNKKPIGCKTITYQTNDAYLHEQTIDLQSKMNCGVSPFLLQAVCDIGALEADKDKSADADYPIYRTKVVRQRMCQDLEEGLAEFCYQQ